MSSDMNAGAIPTSILDQVGKMQDKAMEKVNELKGKVTAAATSAQDVSKELASDGTTASLKSEMKKDSVGLKEKVKKPEVVEQVQQTDPQDKAASEGKETAEKDVKLAEKSGRNIMQQRVMTDAGDDDKTAGDIADSVGKNYGKKLGQEVLKQTSQKLGFAIDEAKKEDDEDKVSSLTNSKKKVDDAATSLGNSNYLEGVKSSGGLAKKLCEVTSDVALGMMSQKAGSFDKRPGLIKSLCNAIGDLISTAKSTPELKSAMAGAKNLKAFSSVTTASKEGHTRLAKENFSMKKKEEGAASASPKAIGAKQPSAKPASTTPASSKTETPTPSNVTPANAEAASTTATSKTPMGAKTKGSKPSIKKSTSTGAGAA